MNASKKTKTTLFTCCAFFYLPVCSPQSILPKRIGKFPRKKKQLDMSLLYG